MEVMSHLAEGISCGRELLQRERKKGTVVGLKVNLPSRLQHLPVGGKEAPVGQTALSLSLGRPGITEVDVDEVHLAGSKIVRHQRRIPHYKKHILQLQGCRPLHGDDHGVRHLLNRNKQNLRVLPCRLYSKTALAAAQLHPQLRRLWHQRLPPLSFQREAVPDMNSGTLLHPGNQVFLLPHPHK